MVCLQEGVISLWHCVHRDGLPLEGVLEYPITLGRVEARELSLNTHEGPVIVGAADADLYSGVVICEKAGVGLRNVSLSEQPTQFKLLLHPFHRELTKALRPGIFLKGREGEGSQV